MSVFDLLIDNARESLQNGGFVMPPLFAMALLLSWALGERALTLGTGRLSSNPLDDLKAARAGQLQVTHRVLRDALEQVATLSLKRRLRPEFATGELANHHEVLRRRATLIRSLVAMAPLLGLLGTVSGMIETFQSLGDMALFAQSGGVAGGVSQALLTTQVGLAVAIPGLLLGRVLDKREARLHDYLERMVESVAQLPAATEPEAV